MNKILFFVFAVIITSCARIVHPYSERESCALCEQILNSSIVQTILSLDSTQVDGPNTNIRIVDTDRKMSRCMQTIKLNNGVIVTTFVFYKFPFTFNSGNFYRDIAIVDIKRKSKTVKIVSLITMYKPEPSNVSKKHSLIVYLEYSKESNSNYELINESCKSYDGDLYLNQYYQKKYSKVVKKF